MITPILILSPNEMRNRDGVVTPSINAGVTIVAGEHGDAWDFAATTGTGLSLAIASIPGITPNRGTLLVRYRVNVSTLQNVFGIGTSSGTQSRFTLNPMNGLAQVQSGYRTSGGVHTNINMPAPRNAWTWHGIQWRGANIIHRTPVETQARVNASGGEFTGLLTLAGTNRNVLVESLLLFDRELTDEQVNTVLGIGQWTWQSVTDALYVPPVFEGESGLRNEEYEVYVTDRNLSFMEPLDDAVIQVSPNWDIDRAGSKGRVTITTQYGVLKPNMWIAVFAVHTPEVGDIQRFPYGHFRLGLPGQVHDGLYELDTGELSQIQDADGSDIVNDLADVRLVETFSTPIDTVIMEEVRALIKLATSGVPGPNLVTNGSFDTNLSGWTAASFPHGSAAWLPDFGGTAALIFNPSAPVDALVQIYQTFPIPAGTQFIVVSGLVRTGFTQQVRGHLWVDFRSEAGTVVDATTAHTRYVTNSWVRVFETMRVPEGVAAVRVYARALVHNPISVESSLFWDDIRLGTCTAMSVPESRISLPISGAVATNRIQTTQGKNLLYDAINGDRLSAISYQALHTFLDGRLTTAPSRTLANTTPKHVYGPDSDLLTDDPITIQSADGNVPNHFIAVKESHEEDVLPLFAQAWNKNPDDPFSIVNNPNRVITAPEIHVPDAVDQRALQDAVNAARDRFSTQEAFTYTAFHDPDLTVFDVVEFTDPAYPRLLGRWLVESIDPDGTVMRVGVRRAVGGWEQ